MHFAAYVVRLALAVVDQKLLVTPFARPMGSGNVVAKVEPMGTPGIYCDRNAPVAARVLTRVPSLGAAHYYRAPPVWGRNGHAQTILASLMRTTPKVAYARELLSTPDGGSLALDVYVRHFPDDCDSRNEGMRPVDMGETGMRDVVNERPFVLLTSGLGGGSQDAYVRSMAARAADAGWHVAVLNMRSCGGSPVTSPRLFSAHRGSTDDVRLAVAHCRRKPYLAARAPVLAAMGWSNGATIINNALAEQETTHEGRMHRIDAAVTLACPLNMPQANKNLGRIFHSQVYDRQIAKGLARNFEESGARRVIEKAQRESGGFLTGWANNLFTVDVERLLKSQTIREIDEQITRKCFGFDSVEDYYMDASSDQRLPSVRVPLLVVSAFDDPLAPGWTIPYPFFHRAETVMLALTGFGGHLGWCDEDQPFGRPRWVEETAVDFLSAALEVDAFTPSGKQWPLL